MNIQRREFLTTTAGATTLSLLASLLDPRAHAESGAIRTPGIVHGVEVDEHVLGEIYARRYQGPNPKYALIISHGLGGHGGMYDLFCTHHSAKGVDVWSYDAPGHGRSTSRRPRGHFEMEEWVQASVTYAEYVRRLTGLPVFLLGSSLGVAASYSALYSDSTEGAILMGAALVPGTPPALQTGAPFRTEGAQQLASMYGRAMRLDIDTLIDYDEEYGFNGAEEQKRLDPYITWTYDLSSLISVFSYEPRIAAADNQKPILVTAGDQDPLFSESAMRATAVAIGGPVEFKMFRDAPHQLLMMATEEFSTEVHEFVTRNL